MNLLNKQGFRKCSCCKTEKKLISENFCSDKNRYLGFSYRCKVCDRNKKDERKERYKKLSDDKKEKHKEKNRIYTSSGTGRAIAMLCAYRKVDRKKGQICDLDKHFILNEIFTKTCFYCGDRNKIGCDRIDNRFGHTKDNVVACCKDCNTTRMNIYTHEEMILLGKTIKEIKKVRQIGMHFQLKKI